MRFDPLLAPRRVRTRVRLSSVANRRFPGLVSSARNGGKSAGRPGSLDPKHSPGWANPAIVAAPDRPDQFRSADLPSTRPAESDRRGRRPSPAPRVEHRTEISPSRSSASPVAMPIRTGNSSSRCAATAASTADFGDANAAHTPSPVCLNNEPPCPSIAVRNISSCAASATRIASASASHRRVEPSMSVNRNVTTPDGGTPRTPAQDVTTEPTAAAVCAGGQGFETNFRESQMSSDSRHELVSGGVPCVSGRLPGSEVLTASLARPSATPVRIARRQRRFVGAVLLQEMYPTDRGLGRGTAKIAATLTWVPVDNGG